MNQFEITLNQAPTENIYKILLTSWNKFQTHDSIFASLSGGADSDVMLDVFERTNTDGKHITYCFFDTGIEYAATKEHLSFLEKKYGISIERVRPDCPVPLVVKRHGVPFISKQISLFIQRLQRHGFTFTDEPFDDLCKKYPRCISALKWWCNKHGDKSNFNIERNYALKEFMIANPPTFNISDVCCTKAKKDCVHKAIKQFNPDMNCSGVRKSEGGARSSAYKNCFSPADDKTSIDNYRPIFFLDDSDKLAYEQQYDVTHSRCYTEYGLKRTGCAGCPFNSKFEDELKVIEKHEPKLFTAVNNIFGESYEYTRAYRRFKEEMRSKK